MKLFTKDMFSNPEIEWDLIDEESNLENDIILLLKNEFKYIHKSLVSILKSKSLNINSANFLIKTHNSQFVLKKFDIYQIKKIKYLIEVDLKISNIFKNIPSIIKNENGYRYSYFNKKLFILYEKVGNHHYFGKKEEFEMFLNTFLDFQKTNINNNIILSCKHQNIKKKSLNNLINYIEDNIKNEILNPIDVNKEIISLSISKLKDYNEFLNIKPNHIDLHPHNISISNKNLFFLDVESFQMTSLDRSLGFGLYKLIRQSYSVDKMGTNSALINSEKLKEICKLENLNIPQLKIGALYEIMRRILIIFDEIIKKNSSEWIFVLPSHIRGLYEIDIIFEDYF